MKLGTDSGNGSILSMCIFFCVEFILNRRTHVYTRDLMGKVLVMNYTSEGGEDFGFSGISQGIPHLRKTLDVVYERFPRLLDASTNIPRIS